MQVHLKREEKEIIQQELKTGRFHTAEEVITEALHALQEKERGAAMGVDTSNRREAVQDMLKFVGKNRVRLENLSVKELIHEGHRL